MTHDYLSCGRVNGFVGFGGFDEATVTVVVGATVVVAATVVVGTTVVVEATVLEASLQDGSNTSRQTIIGNLRTSTLSHPFEQLCFMR